MNPYVEKFIATTKIYLQISSGMTEAANTQNKELTKRHRAIPSAILGDPTDARTASM